MAAKRGFLYKARRIVLCVLLIFMVGAVAAPAPAQAQAGAEVIWDIAKTILMPLKWLWEKAKWAAQQLQLESLITLVTDFNTLMNDLFGEFGQAMRDGIRAINAAQQFDLKARARIGDAIVDADFMTKLAQKEREFFVKNRPPTNEYLCKIVTGQKLVNIADDWEREVSRMAAEAVMYRYRCPTCDGSGVDYAHWEHAFRCGRTDPDTGSQSDVKFGSDLDGYDPSCINNSLVASDGSKAADADKYLPDGSYFLAMPHIEQRSLGEGVTANTLIARAPEEAFWMAKLNLVFSAAGPRPTPARGENMKTPSGRIQRALFNHCAASEAALIKQCTDLLAYHTRPNCAQNPVYCRMQEGPCASAKGGLIESSYWGGCAGGLSPYESQRLQYTMCKTSEHVKLQELGGAKPATHAQDSALCTTAWTSFQELHQKKYENCAKAIAGFNELDGCWAAVEALGSTGRRAVRAEVEAPAHDGAGNVHKILAGLMDVDAPDLAGLKKQIMDLKIPLEHKAPWPSAIAQ